MKVTEIQTDDLVFYQGNPNKVIRILPHTVPFNDVGREPEDLVHIIWNGVYEQVNVAKIDPIPLTDDILRENGFKKKGHRYGIYDDYFDFEVYEYNDGTWLVLYHCCEMTLPDEQILIFHVHQLQHFMKHCGIEQEIKVDGDTCKIKNDGNDKIQSTGSK